MFKKISLFFLIAFGATCISSNAFAASSAYRVFNSSGFGNFNFVDQSGNTETVPASVSNIDNTAPNGAIIEPANNSSIKSGSVISVQASDGSGSGIGGALFYYYNSTANQIGAEVTSGSNGVYSINWGTGAIPDGRYLLFAAIYDKAGNLSVTTPINVTLDNLPPSIIWAEAIDPQTIRITFNEALKNTANISDAFTVYRNGNENSIAISEVSYAENIITLTLTDSLQSSDDPMFKINSGAISDLAGNMSVSNASTEIAKKIIPTITLKGEAEVVVNYGAAYSDAGANCTDFANDSPTLSVAGAINTSAPGLHVLLYDCFDKYGNKAVQVQRNVIVKAASKSSSSNKSSTQSLIGNNVYIYPCQNITYGEWGSCFNGLQYRDILSTNSKYCDLTVEQQAARSRFCLGQSSNAKVLGMQTYAVGSLVRTPDKKTYVVLGGRRVELLKNASQLKLFSDRKIFDVSAENFAQFKIISGFKIYSDGTLLRGPDKKIYVIVLGQKKHIATLKELAKFKKAKIIEATSDLLSYY